MNFKNGVELSLLKITSELLKCEQDKLNLLELIKFQSNMLQNIMIRIKKLEDESGKMIFRESCSHES